MQQQNNEYIGINFFLRFLFNFVTAVVSFVRVSKISFLSNIERQLNGVYLRIIYDIILIFIIYAPPEHSIPTRILSVFEQRTNRNSYTCIYI